MCCVVYDFFTLENLSQIAQIIIATGAIVSIRQIIKNKKKDEAMLNTIEKQKQFYEMQIAEKEKQQKEKEEQEKFDKMFQFVLNFFISVNHNREFNGITYESGKNISSKVASHPSYIVLDKIFNLKLSPNMHLYALFLQVINTTIMLTYRDQDVIDKFNTIDKCYIKILKQELPKILTPDVFDGEKLIVKDE